MSTHTPLEIAQRDSGYVRFHSRPHSVLGTGVLRLAGWIARRGSEITIKVNGQPVETIYRKDRRSLQTLFPGFEASEFEIVVDARHYLKGNSRALHFTAETDRVIAEHFCVLPYQDISEVAESEIIFFLHMPKTAGTALRVVLLEAEKRQYKQSRILSVYEEAPHFPYSQLGALSKRSLLEIDIIYGHLKYGEHEKVRDALGSRPFRYYTVLRQPEEFLRSLYYGHFATLPSIYDWLEKIEQVPLYDNHFTRVIGNVALDVKIGPEQLEQAKQNIDRHFSFVGLQERMPHTTRALSILIGHDLTSTSAYKFNISRPSKERESLDQAEFSERALRFIQFDQQLYRHVEGRFFTA